MKLYMVVQGTLPGAVYRELDAANVGQFATTQEWQWENGCAAVTVDSRGQPWIAVEIDGRVTVHAVGGLMSALRERGLDTSQMSLDYGPIRPAKRRDSIHGAS